MLKKMSIIQGVDLVLGSQVSISHKFNAPNLEHLIVDCPYEVQVDGLKKLRTIEVKKSASSARRVVNRQGYLSTDLQLEYWSSGSKATVDGITARNVRIDVSDFPTGTENSSAYSAAQRAISIDARLLRACESLIICGGAERIALPASKCHKLLRASLVFDFAPHEPIASYQKPIITLIDSAPNLQMLALDATYCGGGLLQSALESMCVPDEIYNRVRIKLDDPIVRDIVFEMPQGTIEAWEQQARSLRTTPNAQIPTLNVPEPPPRVSKSGKPRQKRKSAAERRAELAARMYDLHHTLYRGLEMENDYDSEGDY